MRRPLRVLMTEDTCGGQPRLEGTRLRPVDAIEFAKQARSPGVTLAQLNDEEMSTLLRYCATRQCERDLASIRAHGWGRARLCDGCALSDQGVGKEEGTARGRRRAAPGIPVGDHSQRPREYWLAAAELLLAEG